MQGLFITIEGSDGAGKTTQINLLKAYFEKKGMDVVFTREPGGTRISEAIREIIIDKNNSEMVDKTEVLLYAASRAQHVEEFIRPALMEGKIVICDRYVDSSIVYQGMARGIGIEQVANINEFATSGLEPNLTIMLDLDAETGLLRKKNQKQLDRLESEKDSFHRKVSNGFRALAKGKEERIVSINASLDIEVIHRKIIECITNSLERKRGN
jgi:dTMP kinase